MENGPKSFSAVGTVQLVAVKFAYVDTPKGSVFCPLAAGIAQDEFVPDMKQRYSTGDQVRVEAVRQDAKNGCAYRAKKMRHVQQTLNADLTAGDAGGTNCLAMVVHIDVAFIIADSLDYGGIFVPRSIFGYFEKDFPDLLAGDRLLLTIKSQPERNNCKWVAISVQNVEKMPQSAGEVVMGSGVVKSVSALKASVESFVYGTIVCPLINWHGGDMGTNAFGLDEIISVGDGVAFEAVDRAGVRRAIKWTLLKGMQRRSVTKIDSYTQTLPSVEDTVLRMLRPQLEEMKEKPAVKMLLEIISDEESY